MRQNDDGHMEDLFFAEAVFVALDTADTISGHAGPEGRQTKICFDEIYRFATDPSYPMSLELQEALRTEPRLSADLRHLLDRKMKHRSERCAAASTGPTTNRRGSGFRITLRESRADPNQIYVIIRFDATIVAPPKTLFVIDAQCDCQKLRLPTPNVGGVQLLVESDSALVTALRNPETDVFMQ